MPRGPLVVVGVLVGLLVTAPVAPPPAAARSADAASERERVRSQRAELALQIDTLQADDVAIDRALRDIEANVRAEQGRLADARRNADEAVKRWWEAQASADRKAQEVDALRSRMAQVAVEAYVEPPGHDLLDRLKADTATQAAEKEALLSTRAVRASDLIDQLRAAQRELEQERHAAEQAKAEAEEQAADAERRLADYEAARARQKQFAASVDERLSAKLAEADALAAIDAELAAQIRAEQLAMAERLRATNPEPTPPSDPGGAPPQQPGPTPPSTTPPAPSPPAGPPTTSPPPPPPPPPLSTPPLRTVRGITVAASIADQLEALLAAAVADGFVLGGSGYRDINQQIALRRQNCGASAYAIYEMPASLCTPPTAIPGTSMHERGLAVDFTWNGRAIVSRDSPAFQWMAANAGRFGFINLPSEPWHWSVTGR
ncbi:D-alanyl-D-alanine carboxypeptidase family protein [Rhabdothermincola sediminis]|uniref:D-alanyl-D-alanine carboxypeptidase family protein n=1 Tax=Rhabdothermincola sediminis TaxID=2751370 RepID=UPI001AA061F3|nr:M15 family metallopeptidase [Rhabdothermincola sediminis]